MTGELHLGSMEIELGDGVSLLLWQDRVSEPDAGFDVEGSPGPPLRFRGKRHHGLPEVVPIIYCPSNPESGVQPLVLFENTSYHWKLHGPVAVTLDPGQISSSLKPALDGPRKAEWTQTRLSGEAPGGVFKVVNYLGTAEVRITPALPPLRFEIQSRKFDFHGEYSAMIEDIASRCQQLLLEWESPTSFNITRDPAAGSKILLEQFLFLRHVLGGQKLELYLEEIRRRPHVALATEHDWRPASAARSTRFAANPMKHGRAWHAEAPAGVFAVDGLTPGEILHERRFDTFDTPPNRFIQFALAAFRDVCEEVLAVFDKSRGTAWLEACQMRDTLDVFLVQPFFADVSRLERLPLENQTLQKREGYRDILLAWLMLETASRIDWPGRDDAYDGTNRDAATLYEFWLYFILRDALLSRLGMRELRSEGTPDRDAAHFVETSERGGPRLNLAQNKESISRFRWTAAGGEELGVHLFYNRVFNPSKDPLGGGTYSRRFRPDFTIVFFPAEYLEAAKWSKAEQLAVEAGRIGYLHFDAKYRIEDLRKVFGGDDDAELAREGTETKATDTYRRGDLYKMHAYNDAIRRSAGSYVLYPGRDGEPRNDFPRYEEVIPGVGAFRMRPGDEERREVCEKALADFIGDVLNHHVNSFSRDYRIRHWTHKTLRETPAFKYGSDRLLLWQGNRPPADTQVFLGYVPLDEDPEEFRTRGVFYCHAIEQCSNGNPGTATDLDCDPLRAEILGLYQNKQTVSWMAQVTDVRIVSASERARELGRLEQDMRAAYYFRISFENPFDEPPRDVALLVGPRPGKPVGCTLARLAGCKAVP